MLPKVQPPQVPSSAVPRGIQGSYITLSLANFGLRANSEASEAAEVTGK